MIPSERTPLGAEITARLSRAGCIAPAEEAAEIQAAAPDRAVLDAMVRRRETGEPLAWITGVVEFCGRPLRVDRGVYIPRAQSEHLAREGARLLPGRGRAIDFCTGCGAVASHLQRAVPGAWVIGVDIDREAARCARRNGVPAVVGDLDGPIAVVPGSQFDLVTVVAPYVPSGQLRFLPRDARLYEPRLALDGGRDGLDILRRSVVAASRLLRDGGWLLAELGGEQDHQLAPLLDGVGFDGILSWHDTDGDLRMLAARRGRDGGAASMVSGL